MLGCNEKGEIEERGDDRRNGVKEGKGRGEGVMKR